MRQHSTNKRSSSLSCRLPGPPSPTKVRRHVSMPSREALLHVRSHAWIWRNSSWEQMHTDWTDTGKNSASRATHPTAAGGDATNYIIVIGRQRQCLPYIYLKCLHLHAELLTASCSNKSDTEPNMHFKKYHNQNYYIQTDFPAFPTHQ